MNNKAEPTEEKTVPINTHQVINIQIVGPAGEIIPFQFLPISIGRDAQNDLQFEDNSISLFHARLYFDQRVHEICIEDLNSSNGVLIDDKPTSKNILFDGARIRLGNICLTFHNEGDPQS